MTPTVSPAGKPGCDMSLDRGPVVPVFTVRTEDDQRPADFSLSRKPAAVRKGIPSVYI